MALWKILEIAGALVGLFYIYLEYKASVWLWLTGIIMPAIYIYVYYRAGVYADMGINIYYLVAGLYGWAFWLGKATRRKKRAGKVGRTVAVSDTGKVAEPSGEVLPITHTPLKYYFPLAAVTLASFAVISYVLLNYTNSDVAYWDALTTALSIVGLWMLSRKYLEQWIVWIAVDLICCPLYFYKDLNFTAVLYGIYTVIAVFGYFKWKRMMTAGQGS